MKLLRIKLFTKFETNYRKLLENFINSNSTIREGGIKGLTKRDAIRGNILYDEIFNYLLGGNISKQNKKEIAILAKNAGLAPTEKLAEKNIDILINKYRNKRSLVRLINRKIKKGEQVEYKPDNTLFKGLFPSENQINSAKTWFGAKTENDALLEKLKKNYRINLEKELEKNIEARKIPVVKNNEVSSKIGKGSYSLCSMKKDQENTKEVLKMIKDDKNRKFAENENIPAIIKGQSFVSGIDDGVITESHEFGHTKKFLSNKTLGEKRIRVEEESKKGKLNPAISLINDDAMLLDETLANLGSVSEVNRILKKDAKPSGVRSLVNKFSKKSAENYKKTQEELKEGIKENTAIQGDASLNTYKDLVGDRILERPTKVHNILAGKINNRIYRLKARGKL